MKKLKCTFIIDPIDVIRRWSIKELENFSKNCCVCVIVRAMCIIEDGVTVWRH